MHARETRSRTSRTSPEAHLRRKREWVYHGTYCLVLACFLLCGYLAASEYTHIWFTLILAIQLFHLNSQRVAALVCRIFGLSLAHTKIETIKKRNNLGNDTLVPHQISFERESVLFLPVVIVFSCLLFWLPAILQRDLPFLPLHILAFSTFLTIALLIWKNRHRPALLINANGIMSCSPMGLSCRFISWHDIQTIDIRTSFDVFGQYVRRIAILRDRNGRQLRKLWIAPVPTERNIRNMEEALNAIAGYLGHAQLYADSEQESREQMDTPSIYHKPKAKKSYEIRFKDETAIIVVPLWERLILLGIPLLCLYALCDGSFKIEATWEWVLTRVFPVIAIPATIVLFLIQEQQKVQIRIDPRGLMQRSGFLGSEKLLPWGEIAEVQPDLQRDEAGSISRKLLYIEPCAPRPEIKIDVSYLTLKDFERLIDLIQLHLNGIHSSSSTKFSHYPDLAPDIR